MGICKLAEVEAVGEDDLVVMVGEGDVGGVGGVQSWTKKSRSGPARSGMMQVIWSKTERCSPATPATLVSELMD
ncbi:hypothetical protein AAC387_Pa06g1738 [Persea americana]